MLFHCLHALHDVDCVVSQDIVQGVETVRTVIDAVSSDEVQATFDNL